MAVYEHTYRRYAGPLTPEWSRFLIIPRHAYRDIFKSKLFIGFFVACFVPLLIEAILIYLHHNVNALAIMKINVRELLPIDATFFETFASIQAGFCFLLTLLVGPPLVARDLRNNALPLYLCRPFSRSEYVFGKMSVVLILLSTITWIPELLLFGFQSYLEGFSWFIDNLSLASAIFLSSLTWILVLTLLSQTISSLVKWRVAASAALLGLYLIPSVFSEVINQIFATRWGHLISVDALRRNITSGLFGTFVASSRYVTDFDTGTLREVVLSEPPLLISWFMIFLICAGCLAILSKRVKAYEVIS
ncbi:MAG TPA: ABC transporter permease subunit [Pyrinomonadaceae bacterium]|nr:ABC transporter permease subunit [Pyrinomonadaceae bacterium]